MKQELDLLHFGLSVPMVGGDLPDLPELPECFELLELSGDALALPENTLAAWLKKQQFEEVSFRNLVPADLTKEVNCESGSIVQEFKSQLRTLCARAHQVGAKLTGLDPDWEMLFVETGRRDTFAEILRGISGDLEALDMVVAMAVRLPGSGTAAPEKALELLDRLPAYRLKLALDINPHELLGRSVDWDSVLAPFRFDTASVRLAYESETGNQLLYKHVQPILEAARRWRREVNIFLAPTGNADIGALAEVVQAALRDADAAAPNLL